MMAAWTTAAITPAAELPATAGLAFRAALTAAAALVATGVSVVLMIRQRRMGERQKELESHLDSIEEALRSVEARLEGAPGQAASATVVSEARSGADDEGMRGESIDLEIAPEIQAAIAAAAMVAAGDKARVRSMRQVKAHEDNSAWSKQGRVLVQTSHNVRPRR